MEVIYSRCAGLDVHKESVVACVRLVVAGKITHEVRTFETTTAGLLDLSVWLAGQGATHIAMEATGVYWKPVWHILSDGEFDLVIHSDTLEHVPAPRRALEECRRVVSPQGAVVFTVPVVVGRLTRSREGLPASYHGHPGCRRDDYLVRTEYGANVWADVLEAGFASCQVVAFRYPAGLAFIARPR